MKIHMHIQRRKNLTAALLGIFSACLATANAADPRTNSWLTTYSGQYARIYTSDVNRTNGVAQTTWTNGSTIQSLPVYVGVRAIYSSASWVYIRSSGMASHVMGPWYLDVTHTNLFPGWPVDQNVLYRIPRTNAVPATKTLTGLGAIGYFADGVAMFDTQDGQKWTGSAESTMGTGYWYRDAYVNEGVTFDPANAHQPGSGQHHYHANPIALRYLLGDHVDFNPATKIYTESTNVVTKHSPILGWVRDGFPIYGPYGYANATNAGSGVRRMVSGFVLRNGQSGTQNLTVVGRTNLPLWAVRAYGVAANQTGPANFTTYPLGRYMEDKDYLGDLTNSLTSQKYQQGVDFDLNEYNVRWCVTPEFTNGTYAYFVCITTNGAPAYPYNIGRTYFGSPVGSTTTLTETVTTNFNGGANAALVLSAPVVSNNIVTLTWSAVEGGTYSIANSGNLTTWTTNLTGINAVLNKGTTTTTKVVTNQFFKVIRTGLANYDSN